MKTVTITGAQACGKSRLAIAVSRWGPATPDDDTVQWVLQQFGMRNAAERRTNPAHIARNFFQPAEDLA